MYILMYAMVNSLANVFNNINQVYMAGLMAAPMVLIELLLMGSMYENRALNVAIAVLAIVAGIAFFALIRYQTAVTDRQFLRSMIPRQEIKELCKSIISSQESEIARMKALLQK